MLEADPKRLGGTAGFFDAGPCEILAAPSRRPLRSVGMGKARVVGQLTGNDQLAASQKPAQHNPMLPPSKLNLLRLIKIEAAFGSDIQHDVSMKALREFLEAWKMNVESSHKKNKITISYGRAPVE